MIQQMTLAAHESVAKSKLMQGLVFDQELKALMQKDVEQSLQAIADLQAVYEKAPFQATGRIDPSDIVTHVLPLSEAKHGYEVFDTKTDNCIKVILKP